MKRNMTLVLESKPNNLGTFDAMMLLGHTMHLRNGRNYIVKVDFKSDSVKLFVEN